MVMYLPLLHKIRIRLLSKIHCSVCVFKGTTGLLIALIGLVAR